MYLRISFVYVLMFSMLGLNGSRPCFGSPSGYLDGETLDLEKFNNHFTVPPQLVRLPLGIEHRDFCFVYVTSKDGDVDVLSIREPSTTRMKGPKSPCPERVSEYLASEKPGEFKNGAGVKGEAAFDGDPYETAVIGGEEWQFVTLPWLLFYSVGGQWEAVCMVLVAPENPKSTSGFRSIVYSRDDLQQPIAGVPHPKVSRHESEFPELKCGGIKHAVKNQIPSQPADSKDASPKKEDKQPELITRNSVRKTPVSRREALPKSRSASPGRRQQGH